MCEFGYDDPRSIFSLKKQKQARTRSPQEILRTIKEKEDRIRLSECNHRTSQGISFENDEGDWVDRTCPKCGRRLIYTITDTEEED